MTPVLQMGGCAGLNHYMFGVGAYIQEMYALDDTVRVTPSLVATLSPQLCYRVYPSRVSGNSGVLGWMTWFEVARGLVCITWVP